MACKQARSIKLLVCFLVAAAQSSAFADTHNVAAGTTETLSGVAETSAFVKDGGGTLVLTGDNAMKRMDVVAGTLRLSGGTTTASDSTATGTTADTAVFGQQSGATVVDGATLVVKDGTHVVTCNGTITVTNGTFDATGITGHFMNAFRSTSSECRLVIDNGGVVKTTELRPTGTDNAGLKDLVGVDLNRGGELHIKNFWIDWSPPRYGRINFNGGMLYKTVDGGYLFNEDTARTGWVNKQTVPTVLEGGFYLHTAGSCSVNAGFESGAAEDGGIHISGTGALYWRAKNSTFNGGTWLESNNDAVFALNGGAGDSALGAVPAVAETNIWITGGSHTLFSDGDTVTIHPNRMIFIKDGRRLNAGSQGRLSISGEIHGEIALGKTEPTGTALHVKNGGSWNGTVALDPGAGHTNDVGRLVNYGRLEVASGVTRVTGESAGTGEGSALMFISGNGSAINDYRGHLLVNGGTLVTVPQASGNRFLIAQQHAQTEITNGGKIDMPKACYVNGLSSPAMLTIADGGELRVVTFQFANNNMSSMLHLKSGGKVVASEFWAHAAGGCTVNLDGGGFGTHGEVGHIYFGTVDGAWANASRFANVKLYAKEGGALFDVPEKNLWMRAPIMSGAEHDGGFRKTGAGTLVVQTNFTYNGSTTVAGGTMQCRYQNALPQTTLKLENGGTAAFSLYDTGNWETYTHTEQTFRRIEGNGRVSYSKNVHVTESVAPSKDGQIYFEWACDLNGDLEIEGDANGCGRIVWPRFVLNLSKLTLRVKDFSAFDTGKAKLKDGTTGYRILECASGGLHTGTLNLPADWPREWQVKYTQNGAYLRYSTGTMVVVK
ncbi:MAG: autotransporter-associated beta strand repeat-containing protein [Kiritimatiellae bacterium]|nr:autotransporter-associated beta strand repeat-containing protein [Kiritimatiellia bacterium]